MTPFFDYLKHLETAGWQAWVVAGTLVAAVLMLAKIVSKTLIRVLRGWPKQPEKIIKEVQVKVPGPAETVKLQAIGWTWDWDCEEFYWEGRRPCVFGNPDLSTYHLIEDCSAEEAASRMEDHPQYCFVLPPLKDRTIPKREWEAMKSRHTYHRICGSSYSNAPLAGIDIREEQRRMDEELKAEGAEVIRKRDVSPGKQVRHALEQAYGLKPEDRPVTPAVYGQEPEPTSKQPSVKQASELLAARHPEIVSALKRAYEEAPDECSGEQTVVKPASCHTHDARLWFDPFDDKPPHLTISQQEERLQVLHEHWSPEGFKQLVTDAAERFDVARPSVQQLFRHLAAVHPDLYQVIAEEAAQVLKAKGSKSKD